MNFDHYFDWAATTPIDKDIFTQATKIAVEFVGNPSSVHAEGLKANELLKKERKRCAKALGVAEKTIYFTSGGTESDYLPMISLLQGPVRGNIVVSSIEHVAISAQAAMMKNCGFTVTEIPANSKGIITPEAVVSKIQKDTQLICVMAVNNETGAIQPIYEIADAITTHCSGKRRPLFHVDAVQAIGKIHCNLAHKGINTAAISAHKIKGPRGIGILYMAQRREPFLRGGGQENGIRSGTENLAGIWAMAETLTKYASSAKKVEQQAQTQATLTEHLIQKLQQLQGCTIIPPHRGEEPQSTLYSPWILQASFANIPGQVLVRALSEKGFYISTGSACSNKKNNHPVLDAMGIKGGLATNTVRISFGPDGSKKSIDALYSCIKEIVDLFN
ncbi:MAG TPA: cysteine desulfurase family protein [Treponemataceae bacterium]|nr:cysteine desulfurase family protein [Treponemataceae bacterium]